MEYTAHMDPWCVLEHQVNELVLFGYIHKHQTLGGLSWSRSSPIVELDAAQGWAKTASGRVYKLGRQEWLVDMGAEALCTAALLLPHLGEILNREQHLLAEAWVKACKAARWLDLPPPERTDAAVNAFFEQHADAYIALRKRSGLHWWRASAPWASPGSPASCRPSSRCLASRKASTRPHGCRGG